MLRSLGFGAVMACALVLVACGDNGDANATGAEASTRAAPSSVPPRPVVSPSLLDAGKYPTVPHPPLGVAGDPTAGAISDAQHLADFVLGPWEVDENLIGTYLNSFYVIGAGTVLRQLGPADIGAAADQHGLINGFASARQEKDKTAMVNTVLRFADPTAAAEAAKAMGDASVKQAIKGIAPTAVSIPGHPEAVASTYPFTPSGSDQPRATVRSFTPHGPYVFMQFVQSADGLDRATALIAKAIDAQGPLIDQFTPATDLAAVPLDPTGLLARTLPATTNDPAKNAVYAARGAEHFQSNPLGAATLFKDTGTTQIAVGSTNVYKTKNEGAALMVTNGFSEEVSSEGMAPADPVAALPDSHCYAIPKAFYCVAPAGVYAIEARSEQLADTHQQLSAQYAMLTAK